MNGTNLNGLKETEIENRQCKVATSFGFFNHIVRLNDGDVPVSYL
jgi:hypothetical protein